MAGRLTACLLAALLVGAGAAALTGRAAPPVAKSPAARSAALAVLTSSQRNVLEAGILRVRVRSRRAQLLRVAASARRVRRGAKAVRITAFRRMRFRRAGVRTVALPLTRRGRRALARCSRTRVSAFARRRPGTRLSGKGVAARAVSRLVVHDAQACQAPALAG